MIKNWLKRLKEDERGLTLVELLAVVVVLGIIGGIAFVSIGNVIENSEKDAHVANAIQAISAAELAEASGQLPDDVVDTGDTINATELDTLDALIDPFDDTYGTGEKYDFTLTKTENSFTITSTADSCEWSTAETKETLNTNGRDVCDTE